VAYQVGWADASSRQNRSRIVVRRLLDPEPIGATGGAQRDHSPEWAPDGRKLAFLSKSGAADQLFVLDITTGGTAQQLSAVPEGASAPKWSPDGSRVAFIGTVQSDPEAVVDDPRPPEGREQLRRPPVARVVRRLDYKHDGLGYVDGRYHHLFVVSVSGSLPPTWPAALRGPAAAPAPGGGGRCRPPASGAAPRFGLRSGLGQPSEVRTTRRGDGFLVRITPATGGRALDGVLLKAPPGA